MLSFFTSSRSCSPSACAPSWRCAGPGDSGWRGLSGRPFSLECSAGVLFTVALVVGIAAPVAALAGSAPLVASDVVNGVGVAVAVVGVALTLAAQLSMGESWRIGVDETERTVLVTDGASAIARNPIFTAMSSPQLA